MMSRVSACGSATPRSEDRPGISVSPGCNPGDSRSLGSGRLAKRSGEAFEAEADGGFGLPNGKGVGDSGTCGVGELGVGWSITVEPGWSPCPSPSWRARGLCERPAFPLLLCYVPMGTLPTVMP